MRVMEDGQETPFALATVATDRESDSDKCETWWRVFGLNIINCLYGANGREVATLLTAVVKAQVTRRGFSWCLIQLQHSLVSLMDLRL